MGRNIVSESDLAMASERLQAHLEEQPQGAGCCANHHSACEDGQMTEHGQNTDNLRMKKNDRRTA
jgi:hypothetical protein